MAHPRPPQKRRARPGTPAKKGAVNGMKPGGSGRDKELVMRYEELRNQVLHATGRNGGGLGWAVFVRKGMAAWFEAWQENVRHKESEPGLGGAPKSCLSPEKERAIVVVLTGMVLSHLTEQIA